MIAPGVMDADITFDVSNVYTYIVGATGEDGVTSYASAAVSCSDGNVVCVSDGIMYAPPPM
jgi:hypothetical protein